MFPLDCQPCGKAYTPPVRQSCRTAASNVPIPYADLLLQLVCEFCRNSCVEKSARKKHIFAQQKWRSRLRVRKTGGQRLPFSGVLTRPGSRSSARNSHCPASLSHGPAGPWEPFHLHGQAKPVHAKAPLCGPLVRRACGGRLRVRKTGGQRLPFSGVLTRPGSRSSARNSHCPASFP